MGFYRRRLGLLLVGRAVGCTSNPFTLHRLLKVAAQWRAWNADMVTEKRELLGGCWRETSMQTAEHGASYSRYVRGIRAPRGT